jgi:hypothetical protein
MLDEKPAGRPSRQPEAPQVTANDVVGDGVQVVHQVALGRVSAVEQRLVEVGQRNPVRLLTAAAHHETTFRDSEAPGQLRTLRPQPDLTGRRQTRQHGLRPSFRQVSGHVVLVFGCSPDRIRTGAPALRGRQALDHALAC